jgi:GntR family transcriptional regulator, galactonate operon transcriptional repressor
MNQLRPTKLHEQLAARLCQEIVSGRLEAGMAIPSEPELVAEHGVSKTVVRETVQALASVGVVRVQHGKRTTVLPESEWNILSRLVQEAYRSEGAAGGLVQELYEVRLVLEPEAARWTAERSLPGELEQISRLVVAMGESLQAPDERVRRFLELDRDFHLAIGSAATNRVLRAIVRDIHELLTTSWLLTVMSENQVETAYHQHVEIAQAILARDPEAAKGSMRAHLEWAARIDRVSSPNGRRRARARASRA